MQDPLAEQPLAQTAKTQTQLSSYSKQKMYETCMQKGQACSGLLAAS